MAVVAKIIIQLHLSLNPAGIYFVNFFTLREGPGSNLIAPAFPFFAGWPLRTILVISSSSDSIRHWCLMHMH